MDSMTPAIMKMILALGIVGAVLFFLVRIMRRFGVPTRNLPNSGIRVIATQLIAPQKYISLVEIGGEILALGISDAQITFLTRIENKEFLERMGEGRSTGSEPLSLFQYFQGLSLKPRTAKKGLWRNLYGG